MLDFCLANDGTHSMSTYEMLRTEVFRLKGKSGRGEFSRFLAEHIYGCLSLLDVVALIGGKPSGILYGPAAAYFLEKPKPRTIARKALTLMRVSEDWQTFQLLYGRGLRGEDSGFKVARESLVALPASRQSRG